MIRKANIRQTLHYTERAKERMGLNAKAALTVMQHAYERGLPYEAFTSRERDYLEAKCSPRIELRVYQDHCFLYTAKVCLTVYRLPQWFGHRSYARDGRRIRNAKKYHRFNHMAEAE